MQAYVQLGSLTLDVSDALDSCPVWRELRAIILEAGSIVNPYEHIISLQASMCPFDEAALRHRLGVAARADKAASPAAGGHPPGNNKKARRRRR